MNLVCRVIYTRTCSALPTNSFTHVAVVFNYSGIVTQDVQIYFDGVSQSVTNRIFTGNYSDGFVPGYNPSDSIGFSLGRRVEATPTGYFNGKLDEITFYNRNLSSNEIAAIYLAGSSGKCRTPLITSQPQNLAGFVGQNASFNVAAKPVLPPLKYQWQSNSVAISGATNQAFTLTNLQLSFAAAYTVVVSNSFGSVTSAPPANLSVSPVEFALYPGLKITGLVGSTYGIQYSTNLDNGNGWVGVTNLTFTQPTQIWYDSVPANREQRFYRVLQGPIPIP